MVKKSTKRKPATTTSAVADGGVAEQQAAEANYDDMSLADLGDFAIEQHNIIVEGDKKNGRELLALRKSYAAA